MIHQSASSLLTVVNDVLDFAKLESGQFTTEALPLHLHDCISGALKTMAIRAADQGIDLRCYIAPEITPHLIGDAERIRQVLVNLVGNALKFTPEGHIEVSVLPLQNADISADCVELQFKVEDTGIGIPYDKQAQIFQAFKQAEFFHHAEVRRHRPGSGDLFEPGRSDGR